MHKEVANLQDCGSEGFRGATRGSSQLPTLGVEAEVGNKGKHLSRAYSCG